MSGFVKEFQVCPGASRAEGSGPEDTEVHTEHSEFVQVRMPEKPTEVRNTLTL